MLTGCHYEAPAWDVQGSRGACSEVMRLRRVRFLGVAGRFEGCKVERAKDGGER